jgi:RHS repeat-associated protein
MTLPAHHRAPRCTVRSFTVPISVHFAALLLLLGAPADAGPGEAPFVLDYGYDADGNRTSVSTKSGMDPAEVTTLTYDLRGQLRTVTTPAGIATYTYHADGRPKTIAYGNGAGTAWAYGYAADGSTVSITHRDGNDAVLAEAAYGYDLRGNRVSDSVTIGGQTVAASYGYDAVDRLRWTTRTDASAAVEHSIYSYNRYDRSTERRCAGGTLSFAPGTMFSCLDSEAVTLLEYARDGYRAVTQVTDEMAGERTVYAYDGAGARTSRVHETLVEEEDEDGNVTITWVPGDADTYRYDTAGRLAEARHDPEDAAERVVGQYDYDHDGLRVRVRVPEPPDADGVRDVDLDAFYDGLALVAERAPGDEGLFARYHYDAGGLHAVTAEFAPDVVSTHTVHRGALGSTLLLTDGFGAAASSYRTDPWGRLVPAPSLDDPNALVFTGHQHDAATGLIYMKSRMYDPALGAFLTQDSYLGRIDLPASLHRYLYAYGNPTRYTDPDGRCIRDTGMTCAEYFSLRRAREAEDRLYSTRVDERGELTPQGDRLVSSADVNGNPVRWDGVNDDLERSVRAWRRAGMGFFAIDAFLLSVWLAPAALPAASAGSSLATVGLILDVSAGAASLGFGMSDVVGAGMLGWSQTSAAGEELLSASDALSSAGGVSGMATYAAVLGWTGDAERAEAYASNAQMVEAALTMLPSFMRAGGRALEAVPLARPSSPSVSAGAGPVEDLSAGSEYLDFPLRMLDQSFVDEVGGIATGGSGTAVSQFYPANNGFLGETMRRFLYSGERIDRYGGSEFSRFFSPEGTPAGARALPPGTAGQPLRTFEVVKPFEVEAGTVAPAFGELGLGIQFRTPVQLETLLTRGILREVVP